MSLLEELAGAAAAVIATNKRDPGASLLTGAAVAMAGVIGFVGLAAPHLVRAGVRNDPARVLTPSALAGAALVVAADLVSTFTSTSALLSINSSMI